MENNQTVETPKKLSYSTSLILIGGVVLLALLGYGYVSTREQIAVVEPVATPAKPTEQEVVPETNVPTTPTVPTSAPQQPTDVPALAYRNGVYTVVGAYTAPSGAEKVGITLTLKDDVIVDAAGTVETTHPTSKKFQELFLASFKGQVVGKKLSEVSLDKISGSSLTPKGFNDAVIQIRTEAQA